MAFLDEVDANASEIGAVNTIINRDGKLIGYNTDGPGLIRDLTEWSAIRGKTFIILGAGGAARAAVFALIQEGGTPIVVNRTAEKTHRLADHFGCRWSLPAEIGRLEADCLINTTPLGMFPDTDRTPLGKKSLVRFSQVMDMVYNPVKTRLLREAHAEGCAIRSGVGMFVHQGAEQIRLWTGHGTAAGRHEAGWSWKGWGKWWRLSRSNTWMQRSGSPDRRVTRSGRWSSRPWLRENPASGTS